MPQGSHVSHSYWLHNQFPETENSAGEIYVHQEDYVVLFEYCDLDREQLRLPISYVDHLQNAELITGLASKIYTTALMELSDKMTLVGNHWPSPFPNGRRKRSTHTSEALYCHPLLWQRRRRSLFSRFGERTL